MNKNILFAIILVGVIIFISKQPAPEQPTIQDFTGLIDAGVSVTGRNLYEPGTSLSTEDVRVFKDGTDLGYFSLDSTAIPVVPGLNYKFYFFMNESPSTNYYVDILDYTGLEQDAVDDIFGEGCAIDTKPTFWVVTSGGSTQTSSSNAQSITASGSAEITINIKAHSKECYGIPDARENNKMNTVCFMHNSSAMFSKIETGTGATITPASISTSGNSTERNIIDCFKFPVIANAESVELAVTITAGSTEPTSNSNITVMSQDICFDINKDNLNEIWGYQDEDNEDICGPAVKLGEIYIS